MVSPGLIEQSFIDIRQFREKQEEKIQEKQKAWSKANKLSPGMEQELVGKILNDSATSLYENLKVQLSSKIIQNVLFYCFRQHLNM